ncbi:MAG TPA: hypothetical protein VKD91_09360 [Pyrinomonadaceae bacterium]|nr:hypothetical protein [Pyrinomonadaceae bacterium]
MNEQNEFETLFETRLELDEEELERGVRDGDDIAPIAALEENLLWRENRLTLSRGACQQIPPPAGGGAGMAYYHAPLLCNVIAHPECRLEWARLVVDLSPTHGVIIRDLFPKEVPGDKPVEMATKIGIGLKFEVLKATELEVTPEIERSRTVYFPKLVGAGTGTPKATWNFLALGGQYLHVDRELRLLISAPAGRDVVSRLNLRARIRINGIQGFVPLLARRTPEIDEVFTLIDVAPPG